MSTKTSKLKVAAFWLWTHTSAAIAGLLIIAALILGVWIGRPAKEPTPEVMQTEAAEPQEYTCSMHPTVRLQDPNAKCPICFMDLIPVSEQDGDSLSMSITESARAASRIETAQVGRFFPTAEVRLLGKVTQDETSIARLSAYFPGRIERLFVNYVGIPVSEDDHLAEIFSPELLSAFAELRETHLIAQQTMGMAGMGEMNFDALRSAREKLRLFGISKSQIDSVEQGTYDSDLLTIYAPIGGVVTHLSVLEGDYVQTGDPIATVADLSRLWLDLEAYESQLALLRWGQSVTFTVEAHPGEMFEGRISFIEPIVDDRTRTAAVRVAVDNADLRLKPGMFASAVMRTRIGRTGPLTDDSFAGKWVGPMHPSVVKDARGFCDICGMDLVPAESLGVVGDPATSEPPLVIPRTAVLFTGRRSVVYVRDPEAESPSYQMREVTLGRRAGEFYVVKEGLEEGEAVVVHGAFRIDSAMQFAAKPSMMSPAGGGGGGHNHAGMTPSAPMSENVPDSFLTSIEPVYHAYLAAQERLAADDLAGFHEASTQLNARLDAITELGLSGESLASWRTAARSLRLDAQATTIDAARAHFEGMSDAVILLEQTFGHASGETWHIAYCPMAFDFKGADWLQRGKTINNPYFGESMLQCGEIRQSFPPTGSDMTPPSSQQDAGESDPHEGHDHG